MYPAAGQTKSLFWLQDKKHTVTYQSLYYVVILQRDPQHENSATKHAVIETFLWQQHLAGWMKLRCQWSWRTGLTYLTDLETEMKDLLLHSKTTNIRGFEIAGRLQHLIFMGCIYIHNWVKWPERESNHKSLSSVKLMSGAIILSLHMNVRSI